MRWRLHNPLEAHLLLAQHPDGVVLLKLDTDRDTTRFHATCMSPAIIAHMTRSQSNKVYLTDGKIYAPDACPYCDVRRVRVRGNPRKA